MRLSFGQEIVQRAEQKLVLSPNLILSMKILQLPLVELQEHIEQELQENAVLELRERDPDLPDEPEERETDERTPEERELVVDETNDNADDFERLLNLNEDFPDHFDERPRMSSSRLEEAAERQHDVMANMESRPATLQDYLQDQLRYFDLDSSVRQMAIRIIYALDTNGRLSTPLADLIDPGGGDAQLTMAETALGIVQRLDPPGIAARDLRECLLLQLSPTMPYYEELRTIISDHLHDVERNQWKNIQRRTGYTIDTIDATLKELRRLNPKPGSDFTSTHAPTVTPDVFVERDESGKYVVRLEEGNIPQLYISPYYRKMLMRGDASPEAKEYIKKKISSAQWLIDSIEQRRNTVRKVAQAIVDHQTAFLDKGPEFIEPLKMEQIAEKVGVHLTTVSRAVDDKWIQTPRGIFPLKRFFGGGTKGPDGEEVAWEVVRLKLQHIIDHEDKTKPYSDDELVEELAKHDIKVARRTVTKYRKEMNIPSSRQRRDWAQIAEKNGDG